jgi:hypothetical protein
VNESARKIQAFKLGATDASPYNISYTLYFVLSTYKEVLLLFCDNSEFGVAESPVDVKAEADPHKLPVPEISCQLENHVEWKRLYQIHVQTAKALTNSIRVDMRDV